MQFILVIHIILAVLMIGLILIQHGKGADAGASMSGGGAGTVFGSSGSGNFLSRTTAILTALFFVTSLSLAVMAKKQSGSQYSLKSAVAEQPVSTPTTTTPVENTTTTPAENNTAPVDNTTVNTAPVETTTSQPATTPTPVESATPAPVTLTEQPSNDTANTTATTNTADNNTAQNMAMAGGAIAGGAVASALANKSADKATTTPQPQPTPVQTAPANPPVAPKVATKNTTKAVTEPLKVKETPVVDSKADVKTTKTKEAVKPAEKVATKTATPAVVEKTKAVSQPKPVVTQDFTPTPKAEVKIKKTVTDSNGSTVNLANTHQNSNNTPSQAPSIKTKGSLTLSEKSTSE